LTSEIHRAKLYVAALPKSEKAFIRTPKPRGYLPSETHLVGKWGDEVVGSESSRNRKFAAV
jgi:hypothetical protein